MTAERCSDVIETDGQADGDGYPRVIRIKVEKIARKRRTVSSEIIKNQKVKTRVESDDAKSGNLMKVEK